ncbi:MAG: isoprenylcysteine carboxylmethyltransferase family protein [Burkholderiaceae bacterium]|nr:isoprenylcysteine carboxylmethyltransferase family protein [Burkholderiaceae bacterium]MBP6816006.1 isoprenylcysteine carboxylmethyltransferase family protein [Burkholderiaceae bacterium]MBP7659486.1 isoprenylcysteine carboxylmethyltransferase family protein [Burkholderiaceae bacterium]
MPESALKTRGTALVAAQLALIALLGVAAAPAFLQGQASFAAWAMAALGAALGLWALASNRPGNFNIRPLPRQGGQLIRSGPYRHVRHPMYTAVIACGTACALALLSAWSVVVLLVLTGVLVVKASVEEQAMVRVHPDYADYQAHTRRFVPGIY